MSEALSFTVGTADLRSALLSVRSHACADHELPELARIRFVVDAENATITATDRFTIGMAIVSVIDADPATEGAVLEVLPEDVSKVLSIFKSGKETGEAPEYLLRFEIERNHVTIVDCSGMLDGRALRIPRLPTGDALSSIPDLVAKAQRTEPVLLEDMVFGGRLVARFNDAAKSYSGMLVFESHAGTRAILIRCGESFLGLLMPMAPDEETIALHKQWSVAWDERLPEVTQ